MKKYDISEGIDVNKSSNSKDSSLCHFWYFIDKNFNYEPYLCNGSHSMSMKVVSIKSSAIIYSKGNAYRVNFAFMSISDATKLMNNSNLNNKGYYNEFFSE